MISVPQNKIIFFSPSYREDFERFSLLAESVNHYCQIDYFQCVAVPKRDLKLFSSLSYQFGVKVICQEDLVHKGFLPSNLYRLINKFFPRQSWRFKKYSGRPGWIVQQIVKLSTKDLFRDRCVVIFDSDVIAAAPFDKSTLCLDQKKRVLMRCTPEKESGKHRKHIVAARKLLRLHSGSTEHHYMSTPAIVYTDVIADMCLYLETLYKMPWQLVLLKAGIISEYSLYGIYLEEILDAKGYTMLNENFSHVIWDDSSFQEFVVDPANIIKKGKKFILIQSNLKIDVCKYKDRMLNLRHL